jgi:hypothetical protein
MTQSPLNARIVKTVEVLPKDGKWVTAIHYDDPEWPNVKIQNSHQFKYQARREGRVIAIWIAESQGSSVQLLVKDRKGVIREHNTYGYDPEGTKG